ncbi:YggS family pyridoxal phosphate-dependent enzyme [Synechococcus elongatus]|uniref:YggS family pyridoxal phosphate-dependent enzyme n=1 Tax=Synechococcus elongatus TaxID=32046 RepID=UPI000F7F5217|nr:YggS family pyridoxal phosphate-dependent enzyme [Synechococcus elongatus]
MAQIAERLASLRSQLPPSVQLIAVSKNHPAAAIREAYAAGQRHFGENRVQEAIAKQAELTDLPDLTWHLLGQLQSNKARKAVEHFDWIHSVDSWVLAERLDRIAGELGRSPKLCLQVKLLPDPNKAGWDPADLRAELPQLSQLQQVQIRGLMVIAPLGLTAAETQALFAQARTFAAELQQQAPQLRLTELSMGMSSDWPLAVAEGATWIRVGTQLFGPRSL